MSVTEKAVSLFRTVFTFKERLDDLSGDLDRLGDRLMRLGESHAALRDRVSRIEGMIEGAEIVRRSQARISE